MEFLLLVQTTSNPKSNRFIFCCRMLSLLRGAMAKWQGVRWYLKVCGIRGILKIGLFRLFKRPTELTVLPFGKCHPICLRIDTSDFCSFQDVLICSTMAYFPAETRFDPRTIIDVGDH